MSAASRLKARALPALLVVALASLVVAVAGRAPRAQSIRLVLGDRAAETRAILVRYLDGDGELEREADLRFGRAGAPRVVSLEPTLADGPYTLQIEVEREEGRTVVERRVTLSGGTLQVPLDAPQ